MDFLSLLFRPQFYADPYVHYRALREARPVLFTPLRGGSWILTSYASVASALRDERLSNARVGALMAPLLARHADELERLGEALSGWLLHLDGDRHGRLRRLLGRAFAQSSIDLLRHRVRAVVDRVLDPIVERGRMDLIHDFAYELPLRVIMELLGLPDALRPGLLALSNDLAVLLSGTKPTVELARRALAGLDEMTEALRPEVARRRSAPGNDILSALVSAEENGDVLGEGEVYNQVLAIMFAGHETTRNLIGNGAHALLRNPEQWERLRRDPTLLRPAVEELLRYDSPIQMVGRVAREDLEHEGHTLKRGQIVMCFIGAANRDPAVFPDPDRLDLTRPDNRHLSFGPGPHVCLGAGIARLECQVALTALLERAPGLRLDREPEYAMNLSLRGLKALPVSF